MDIRTELEEVVNIRQSKIEKIGEYTVRLVETVNRELDDAVFDALSKEAQEWMNTATKAYMAHQKLPSLPEIIQQAFEKPLEGTITDRIQSAIPNEGGKPHRNLMPTDLNKAVLDAFKVDMKPPKKEKKIKIIKKSEPSTSSLVRDVIATNHTANIEQINKILVEKKIAHNPSAVRGVYSYVVGTMKTLDKLGLLKNTKIKGVSDSARLKELICCSPTASLVDIQKEAVDQGIKCSNSTIEVVYYHVKITLETLRKLGMVD